MSEMLRRTIGEQVRVETVLAEGLWHCFADTSQLESTIINLTVDARDAMPDGGKLTIGTANAGLDDRYARTHEKVQAGQYVMIVVSDSGTGMTTLIIERRYPFYATKGVGKGTELGLSQVFGYVKQCGSHVKTYSEIGQGTAISTICPDIWGTRWKQLTQYLRPSSCAAPQPVFVLVVEDENFRGAFR
jgi:signal transduction histidine kinase